MCATFWLLYRCLFLRLRLTREMCVIFGRSLLFSSSDSVVSLLIILSLYKVEGGIWRHQLQAVALGTNAECCEFSKDFAHAPNASSQTATFDAGAASRIRRCIICFLALSRNILVTLLELEGQRLMKALLYSSNFRNLPDSTEPEHKSLGKL